MSMRRRMSEQEMARGCELYRAGGSTYAVARDLGVSHAAVGDMLKRRGVACRSLSDSHRLYRLNQRFFSSLDCKVKAYWLGFLAGDGCVRANEMRLQLQRRDRAHLERFLADLGSTVPIHDRVVEVHGLVNGAYEISVVSLRSWQIVSDLARFGVVQAKSFTVPWPAALEEGLLRHWCRGYVDANGSIDRHRDRTAAGGRALNFAVTGNRRLLGHMQAYLMRACGLRRTKLDVTNPPEERIVTLRYCGNRQVPRIWHFLYDYATVWLPRKRVELPRGARAPVTAALEGVQLP